MNHKEYMRYLELRRKEIELRKNNFNLEKERERMKKDQEMFDKYMDDFFSLKNFFPEFADVPLPWIIIGIVAGLFLLIGVFL